MDIISKFLNKSSVRSKIYAAVILVAFSATALFFVWALVFSVKMIRLASGGDEGTLSEASIFDFKNFAPLSGRLDISFETQLPQPAPETQAVPPSAASSTGNSSEAPNIPVDLSGVRIQILNATGIPGLAKSWQDKFASKNFKEIATGNYTVGPVSGTLINYQPSAKNTLVKIKEVLATGGIDVTLINEKEDSTQNFDLIIVLGK